MKEKKGILFKKTIYKSGGSLAITLPQEICEYLEAEENTELELGAYDGKHGKFIAIWKKKQE